MNLAMTCHNVSHVPKDLLKLIEENPGIRYRDLSILTGLCNGVLSYHLGKIERAKNVTAVRENKRVTRYYHTNTTTKESSIIGSIRSCNTRRIILSAILKHNICTFRQIVELTSRAPSTVLWHIRRLERANIIAVQKRNGGQYNRKHLLYELNDMESTASILSKFRLLSHMDTKNNIECFHPQLVQWR